VSALDLRCPAGVFVRSAALSPHPVSKVATGVRCSKSVSSYVLRLQGPHLEAQNGFQSCVGKFPFPLSYAASGVTHTARQITSLPVYIVFLSAAQFLERVLAGRDFSCFGRLPPEADPSQGILQVQVKHLSIWFGPGPHFPNIPGLVFASVWTVWRVLLSWPRTRSFSAGCWLGNGRNMAPAWFLPFPFPLFQRAQSLVFSSHPPFVQTFRFAIPPCFKGRIIQNLLAPFLSPNAGHRWFFALHPYACLDSGVVFQTGRLDGNV